MPLARLIVERAGGRSGSQDWGAFDFLSVPSPGDRVAAPFEGDVHHLTVISVHHRPVAAGSASGAAEADVVARWTSRE
ncbi:hypothetical protein EMQ25_09405 [Arsenicitalea aurantiaca]|uniref:Uncharacterized protein n=1 Tax=Arsenicitalea aurantiaca TaxID=1783274 RepID=A0A433XAK4_9HYPH|nr:hypothetical protein [Arsenicitalea aurantiaca]RUT31084.1 hypothetical protein EMQ25_09405 [Arsenicitalea aurantiaca]